VISGHLNAEPDYLADIQGSQAPMPPGLVALLKALLAKRPEDRPAGCAQVLALCQARVAELRSGAAQARTGFAGAASLAERAPESSTFRRISGFMERNLGSATSEYQGRQVVHTTRSERLIVWVLLVAFVVGFLTLYFSLR
jgi:hypothetical protein